MNKLLERFSLSNALHILTPSRVERDVLSVLRKSQTCYPDILQWYYSRFTPGLTNGTRAIFVYYVDNNLAGLALVKSELMEKKICTFYVKEEYRYNGIGGNLFQSCFEFLGTDKPMITVSDGKVDSFTAIFKHYAFRLEQVLNEYYSPFSREYVYNGWLNHRAA
jgi:predicted GNAT family N-acyltransferase